MGFLVRLRRFIGKTRLWMGRNCALYSGYCISRDCDMVIALHWNPVENPKRGQIRWHDSIEIYWDWLPEVWWRPAYEPSFGYANEIRATRWTGRKRALGGFRWYLGACRIRSRVR